MSRRLLPVLLLIAAAALAGCGGDDDGKAKRRQPARPCPRVRRRAAQTRSTSPATTRPTTRSRAAKEVDPPPSTPTVGGEVSATLVTSLGDIKITLDAANAPCTVNSFVSLATQGYFDDQPVPPPDDARPESGIAVLQCGDPTGTGSGGPGYTYADETKGDETYGPGVLAMANRGADTNGSQFFIVYDDSPLPPDYTVFGTVDDDCPVQAVSDLAAQGTVPGEGGMTAPAEKVTIDSISWK